jgi:FtsP/CotA-like multicopper oxidase with cupredoxin domain
MKLKMNCSRRGLQSAKREGEDTAPYRRTGGALACGLFLCFLAVASLARAAVVEYDLVISETPLAPAGKPRRALTINGGVPGPVLRFTEGDTARITVRNNLKREETSLHWHGVLVPNVEDGVPLLTTPRIGPGQSRVFEFPIKHAGTYWYHSHTGLQEQRGVYGGIVIAPRETNSLRADREEVLVLSDWTDDSPDEVMKTLMRGSDWYAIRKGTAQSVLGAARAGHLKDFFQREWSRLPPMDVSDVAYDAFLINGQRQITLTGKPGETLRLRVINAGASTYFYLESSAGPLTIVANDGMDVKPIRQTYDVLVTVPPEGRWEFRASANDGSGFASAFFGEGEAHPATSLPRPNGYSMNVALAAVLDQLDETGSLTDTEALAQEQERPLPPYRRLRATGNTTIPGEKVPRTIPLRLTGDMMRYIWSINGKTLNEDSTIFVKRGEVVRFEIINNTMMHHPMHLHGHFFRLIMDTNAPPDDAPLKHTVDVPPMSRRTIEFLANEEKDWLFHCHVLYHMHAGMGRVVSYAEQGPEHKPNLKRSDHDALTYMADFSLQTHMSMGMAMVQNARNNVGVMWDVGWGRHVFGDEDEQESHDHMHHHMHDEMPAVEYEIDLVWQRYFNPRWSSMLGWRFTNMEDESDRAFGGAMYTLPGMFMATATVDTEGDFRFGLAKNLQLTSRLGVFGKVEYDTGSQWKWTAGATWTLSRRVSLITQYDSHHRYGGGLQFRF